MKPTLLLMAAGMGSRYGGLKQVEPMGPGGESLVDYAVYDALRAGFGRVVFVVRREIEGDFRETVLARVGERAEAELVFQDLRDLPAGAGEVDAAQRSKPWGTAHAVWSAREAIAEPFAVLNADDYYGPEAFQLLADHLRRADGDSAYAVVGYRLADTLSEHGTVARGILERDGRGRLTRVVERTQVSRGEDGRVADRPAGGTPVDLDADADVSMNIWGFRPGVFAQLEAQLSAFLRERGGEANGELYLPDCVGELVAEGQAEVKVLSTRGQWFGVTYAADADSVRDRLRALVADGTYPPALWD